MLKGLVCPALLAAAFGVAGTAARAQSTTDTTLPAAPHRLALNVAALRPGTFTYQLTVEHDSITAQIGTRVVTVAQASYAGTPAWLVADVRATDAVSPSDTVFLSLASLAPLHWGSTIGPARLAGEFRGDTVYGGTSAPSGRRSIVAAIPPGALLTQAMLETELRLLPLGAGWEDSTSTISVTLSGNVAMPTRLSVIGDDHVQTPAGSFDCWVVAAHTDASRGLYWITKRDPIVVRSALDVPTLGPGAQLVGTLMPPRQ